MSIIEPAPDQPGVLAALPAEADASATLRARVNALPWHHQIDFGHGVVSPGGVAAEVLRRQADIYFQFGIRGHSFLDIGCWDGFNSIEAHRRGAASVLATDHYVWSDQSWGKREAFDLAREHLAPEIMVRDIDLPDLTPDNVGTFDTVLFAGVFYHLRHPFAMLEQVTKLAGRVFIVETQLDAMDQARPAMVFYPGRECNGDPTNWWGPNPACVDAMLRDLGFPHVVYTPHPDSPGGRGIFHAFRP